MKTIKMKPVTFRNEILINEMDVFDTRYYNLNKRVLSLVGLWPFQSAVERTVRIVSLLLFASTLLIPQILMAVRSWGDTNLFIECLSPTVTHVGCIMKLLNAVINMKKLKELLVETRINWEKCPQATETRMLQECGETGRRCTIYYMTIVYTAVTLWILTPTIPKVLDLVAPLNQTRPNIVLFQTDYKVDPDKYFYPILIHGSVVCTLSILMLVATDTLYMATAQHARGLFGILRYRLENIIEAKDAALNDCTFESEPQDDICYLKISLCVETHRRTIQYVRIMESSYEWCLVVVLGFSLVVMSCTGSRVVAAETSLQDALRFGGFTLAQVIHLFCNSLPGQWIMDASSLLRNSAYNTQWYFMSRRSRRLIVIILRRTATPCTIAAGKLYVMSMENFCSVLQTSMSYFTLLTSMQ